MIIQRPLKKGPTILPPHSTHTLVFLIPFLLLPYTAPPAPAHPRNYCQVPNRRPAHSCLQAWNKPLLLLPGTPSLTPLPTLDLHLLQNQPQHSSGDCDSICLFCCSGSPPRPRAIRVNCVVICTSCFIA